VRSIQSACLQSTEGAPSSEVRDELKKLLEVFESKRPLDGLENKAKSKQQCSHCAQRKLCSACGRCGKTWYCSAACQVPSERSLLQLLVRSASLLQLLSAVLALEFDAQPSVHRARSDRGEGTLLCCIELVRSTKCCILHTAGDQTV
jgi:hypothetical protein